MKNKRIFLIFIITMIFTIIFSLATVLNVILNLDYCFDIKSIYYCKTVENSKMPLWLFNGIDVDEKGNIYIGNNMGVSVYDETGHLIGSFYSSYSKDFTAFKIDDNKISFISKYNFDKSSSNDKSKTYEAKFDLNELEKTSEDVIISDKLLVHNKSFSNYKSDNKYSINNEIVKNGRKYKYEFYGKVVISDNNSKKIVNLEKDLTPIPTRFPAITALVFLAITIFLGVLSYRNRHR